MKVKCPNNECQVHGNRSSSTIVKHGFFRVRGGRRRRYRCRTCGRTFSNRTRTAYYGLRCSRATFERVAMLSVEGVSRAAIARIERVNWKTADRWLVKATRVARAFRAVELVELQADELRTVAPSKKRPTWVFTSIEVSSRLWLSTVVGRRSFHNTSLLLNDTLARTRVIATPLVTTDGFKYYRRVIEKLFGVACVYAQVIKTIRKNRIVRVAVRSVIGSDLRLERAIERSEDSLRVNTAFVERLNLTLRRSLAYLARRSPSHARCPVRLRYHLELLRYHYNFCRQNLALRFGAQLRTPAMQAGLSERQHSFRDIFASN